MVCIGRNDTFSCQDAGRVEINLLLFLYSRCFCLTNIMVFSAVLYFFNGWSFIRLFLRKRISFTQKEVENVYETIEKIRRCYFLVLVFVI